LINSPFDKQPLFGAWRRSPSSMAAITAAGKREDYASEAGAIRGTSPNPAIAKSEVAN
jgi:hypothetical protein